MAKTKIQIGLAVVVRNAVKLSPGVAVTGAILQIVEGTAAVRWSSGIVTTEPLTNLVAVVDAYELVGRRAEVQS